MDEKFDDSKNPKKWCFFWRDVLLYDNKRPILKKGPRGRLALETSFQTKKNIWLNIVLGQSSVGATPSKPCSEKKRKRFSVLSEKCLFFDGNHQKFWPKTGY